MIKEAQFQSAVIDKNTTMLIWLGKHRLGQRELDTSHHAQVAETLDKILDAMMKRRANTKKDEENSI